MTNCTTHVKQSENKNKSRYLEYSISRTLDISNKTIGPIVINLHKVTTR